jgi:T-complex protein 1 subunit gamma
VSVTSATGATIVSRTDEIKESDIGLGAGLFDIRKVGLVVDRSLA